jgi:hypothetical protein
MSSGFFHVLKIYVSNLSVSLYQPNQQGLRKLLAAHEKFLVAQCMFGQTEINGLCSNGSWGTKRRRMPSVHFSNDLAVISLAATMKFWLKNKQCHRFSSSVGTSISVPDSPYQLEIVTFTNAFGTDVTWHCFISFDSHTATQGELAYEKHSFLD